MVNLNYLSVDGNEVLTLTTDAVGAILQQNINGENKSISFISLKLNSSQRKYSTFSRELSHLLTYPIFLLNYRRTEINCIPEHRLLTYALYNKLNKYLPCETRHLDYISQFTSDIWYIKSKENIVADALSPYLYILHEHRKLKLREYHQGTKERHYPFASQVRYFTATWKLTHHF